MGQALLDFFPGIRRHSLRIRCFQIPLQFVNLRADLLGPLPVQLPFSGSLLRCACGSVAKIVGGIDRFLLQKFQ